MPMQQPAAAARNADHDGESETNATSQTGPSAEGAAENVGERRATDSELEEMNRKRRRMWEEQTGFAQASPPRAYNRMGAFATPFAAWPQDSDSLPNAMSGLNPMAARSAAGAAGNSVMMQQLASMQHMLALQGLLNPLAPHAPHSMSWGRAGMGALVNAGMGALVNMPAVQGGGVAGNDAPDKNKNCHFCEHAPKRCAIFACLDPVCDQMFCENCCKRHLGQPTSFKGQQDAWAANWRCPLCTKLCCCTQAVCNKKHLHCKRYRRKMKHSSKRAAPNAARPQDAHCLAPPDQGLSANLKAEGDAADDNRVHDKGDAETSGSADEDAPAWQQHAEHAGAQHHDQHHHLHDHLHLQLPAASRKRRDQHSSRLTNGSGSGLHWHEDAEDDSHAQGGTRMLGRSDSRSDSRASFHGHDSRASFHMPSSAASGEARSSKMLSDGKMLRAESTGEIARFMGAGPSLRRASESAAGGALLSLASSGLTPTALSTGVHAAFAPASTPNRSCALRVYGLYVGCI